MFEKAVSGGKNYWTWLCALGVIIAAGFITWIYQFNNGLMITGMSRDVTWGFYIAQFTFLVGVAASAVMLVIPYYLHHYKTFGRIVILGEFLAIAAVTMCLLFILVDMGRPDRALNVIIHATPGSILFWDMVVLNGYLFLNAIIGYTTLQAERNGLKPPSWVKPLIYLSVPWAVSIHTVTAFLYCGLPGRGFWLTAILAPRFLASAFAAGPAVLILLALLVKKMTKFDAGKVAIESLAKVVAYSICINIFFLLLEVFVVFYSNIPDHKAHLLYLFAGYHGHDMLVPWMWSSMIAGLIAIILLVNPKTRQNLNILPVACVLVFVSTWIDKGLGMIAGGFTPNPLHEITDYVPTAPELLISLAVWCTGAFILTVLYKVATGVKKEVEAG